MRTATPGSTAAFSARSTVQAFCFLVLLPVFGQNNPENAATDPSQENIVRTESEDFIFTNADVAAAFPGGAEEMKKFIKKNLVYPPDAKTQRITGIIHVRFVVRKDGSITNVEVTNGGYSDLNIESIRMVKSMPKWLPAINGAEAVSSYVNLTLLFQ